MQNTTRRILANIMFLASSQGIASVLATLYALVIPNYLGPANVGILTLVGAISAIIAVIANFGTRLFILREVARDVETGKKFIGLSIWLNCSLSLAGWLVVLAISLLLKVDSTTLLIGVLIAVSSVIGSLTIAVGAALQGMDKMHYSLYSTLLQKGLGTGLAIFAVMLNLGIAMIVSADMVVGILITFVTYRWIFKHLKFSFRPEIGLLSILLKGGLAFFVVDITFNIYLYLDSILLSILTTKEVVGYYGLANQLFGTVMTAPSIIGAAILPTLSRFYANEDNKERSNILSKNTLSFFICISLPMAVGVTEVARPLILFIYTNKYAPSIPIMIVLAWTGIFIYWGIGIYQILTAQGKQAKWAKVMLMAGIINLLLNLFLIPLFQSKTGNGAIGAALSLFFTEVAIGFVGIKLVGYEVISKNFWRDAFKSLLASVIMGVVILPLQNFFVLVPIMVGILVYGTVSIYLFGLGGTIKKYIASLRNHNKKPDPQIVEL